MDGGKRVVFEGLTPIMPIKSETIRQEEVLRMKYSSSTDMKSVLVAETNTPIDMITIASGEIWLVTKNKETGQILKTKIDSEEPKIITVPLDKCDYGLYVISNNTVITIKKNYRRSVTTTTPLVL